VIGHDQSQPWNAVSFVQAAVGSAFLFSPVGNYEM
jgi:hypothetical protein